MGGGNEALLAGCVGKRQFAGHVADGINARQVGAQGGVDDDGALVHFQVQALPDHVSLRLAPHAEQDLFHSQGRPVAKQEFLTVWHGFGALDANSGRDLDSRLFQRRGQAFGDLFILRSEDAGQKLYDLGLNAESIHDGGEFTADHTSAYNCQTGGQLVKLQHSGGRQDPLFVDGNAGKVARQGTRSHDQVVGCEIGSLIRFHQIAGSRFANGDSAFRQNGDPALLKEKFNAAHQLLDHRILAGENLPVVQALNAAGQTETRRFLQIGICLGASDQGFGGNAAPVQAYSADASAFDHCAADPILVQPDCSFIASGSASDDHNLVMGQIASLIVSASGCSGCPVHTCISPRCAGKC